MQIVKIYLIPFLYKTCINKPKEKMKGLLRKNFLARAKTRIFDGIVFV